AMSLPFDLASLQRIMSSSSSPDSLLLHFLQKEQPPPGTPTEHSTMRYNNTRSELVVDKTKRKKRRELSEEQKQEIKDAFELFDTDKDHAIDYHELKILKDYDREATGKITFEDFNEVVTDWILERDPHEEILKAFKLFDDDDSGKISLRNLRRVARELGENMSDEELRAMIEEFDKDGDGENTFSVMFIAALFITARNWKQYKCPSTDEWVMKI
ncbi:hypothetical protein STEG23_022835, partial [Scotinomys teguina]